ncbi:MAG: pteridine reductase [Gammaproteobacteria bacterium]|nr:MAG: pteridine reductase [Gammaproteobacteria bacterium]
MSVQDNEENMLKDKVVLITGGARRIGAQVCRTLHAQGMRLVIHYRSSDEDAHALQKELLAQRADSVMLVQGDMLNVAKLKNLVHETIEAFGRLDVLINNASTFYTTPLDEADESQWEDLLGTNLKAPFFLAQAAAAQLRKHQGCIINMADIHGERPLKTYPIYSIAKAGMVMLTKSLARELGPDVRVNGIAPGAIMWPENEMDDMAKQRIISRTPLRTVGSPEDIARTILFLIRDAGFINGHVISVCGGRSVVL